jgi:iron complex transport system substrate-binding protein
MRPLLSLLALLLLLACGAPPRPSTLDAGPSRPPQRILSLSPAITETLFALGAGDRVVGRTDFCRWPAEAQAIPSVGGLLNIDWEKVYALHPDLAILIHSDKEAYGALEARGIERLTIRSDTLDQVRQGILEIASRIGVPDRGRALVAGIDASLEAVARRLHGVTPLRTLILIGREPGTFQSLYAAGSSSFVSELCEHAGAVNVLGPTLGAFPEISRETILADNPEVIIDTCLETLDSPTPEIETRERALYAEVFPTLEAVKSDRVILWTDPHLTIPGPSMATEVEALARAMHPEAYAD